MVKEISKWTLQRLPVYLGYLKTKKKDGVIYISSPIIARDLHLNEVQVRKDIAGVSTSQGKPKIGHKVSSLIEDIESYLGYDCLTRAVLVGAGQLGRALISYQGFINYGLDIVAAFDTNRELIGSIYSGKEIYSIDEMQKICEENKISIGIITVNSEHAQKVCDELVSCGIKAIWNFAPTHLKVPSDILVQNENMAASLAILSKHLTNKNKEE